MTVKTEWVRYGDNHAYLGYLAAPERVTGPQPAVVVFQEIWGVDDHIQHVTRRFAEAGYIALAPDLYAQNGQRPEALAADRVAAVKKFLETVPPSAWNNPAEREEAMNRLPEPQGTQVRSTFGTLFGGMNLPKYVPQMLASTKYLREEQELSRGGKIGSVGFCMGGALSALLATEDAHLSAAVIFYGNSPSKEAMAKIACPVYGFYGSLDPRISDTVPQFADDMKSLGKSFQYKIYEGAHHAFFNDDRASYNVSAARDAFATVLGFYQQHLQ
jgi:carboxymethylenebutenolidase